MIPRMRISNPTFYLFYGIIISSCLLFGYRSNPTGKQPHIQETNNPTFHPDSIAVYPIDLLPGLDTLDFEATITLDPTQKSHFIHFPNGGTGTTVHLFASPEMLMEQGKTPPLATASGGIQDKILLEVTSLAKGTYTIQYLSCGLGGIFPLTLQ